MAATINTNQISLNAQRNLSSSQAGLATAIQRLSSGLRVNSAKDDAAGLAISERMNAQVRGFNVAIRNANDGISMAQTAEGAMQAITDNLQRMRELAIQAMNGTVTTGAGSDAANLDTEFQQLQSEIGRVMSGTTFNGQAALNITADTKFQVGAGTGANDSITVSASQVSLSGALTGVTGSVSAGFAGASAQVVAIDAALDKVNTARANWGAVQNRFQSVIQNLQVSSENIGAARGRIIDADFAQETANMTRGQILQQAGTAMLAQANSIPNNVLTLLRGG
ncbi:flagellin [Azoarcus sp. KH32C]|uniref:flagellin N-terminal helical domain-containing protein n=1 Tax=Azoarcus sp. KH32C TaxID=748247 RepID=UPI0002386920|nr:flagellin [Azoarcus sp. KH32C]BAL23752.1 flagellin and related hook-associated protein [Azoarcus sp. KH32C]